MNTTGLRLQGRKVWGSDSDGENRKDHLQALAVSCRKSQWHSIRIRTQSAYVYLRTATPLFIYLLVLSSGA